MKSILLLAALLSSGMVWGGAAHAADHALYGQRIVLDADTNAVSNASANELARWLGQMTDRKFEISSVATNAAIFLVRTNSGLAAAADVARLREKGTEGFVIRSDGRKQLWIVGNSDLALQDGVYHYLDQLGCRWFLPNDHWMIIPHRDSITLKIDRVEAPAFRSRSLGMTGGFGKDLAIDPKAEMQARWKMWQTRNRLVGDMFLSGHAGEGFNTRHKAELIAHPEYLAEVNGKREWSLTAKPCVSNPDAVKLYVEDRLSFMKGGAGFVSVDPADGSGFCTCEKCKKIGSGSPGDQAFYLANQVAKAARERHPGWSVNLYAYWEHASVPSIDLETNVYVVVVPYGLQRTGYNGDELLMQWEKKVPTMGVYDYWLLPDWNNCLPELSVRDTVPAKIRFWHKHHVDVFMGQSGASAGNIGIVGYVASRLLWNPDADVKALLDEFYEKSFGPAAPPMRRMFDRWSDGFMLTGNELGESFRDIQAARALAKDDATRARVNDFALYVQYLRLWAEYRGGGKDHRAATEALFRYMWRIYDSAMVATYRMQQWITYSYEKNPQWIQDEWPILKMSAPVWTNCTAISKADIDQMIADGVRDFVPVEYDRHTYSAKLVPLVPPAPKTATDSAWQTSPIMSMELGFNFWAPRGVHEVELQLRCGPRRNSAEAPFDRVTVYDPNGGQILSTTIAPDGAFHPITIPTKRAGAYRMVVLDMKLMFTLKVPAGLRFTTESGLLSVAPCPRVYFFVPKGLKRIAMLCSSAAPIQICDGDGKPFGGETNGLIVRDVPAGQDGRVWSLQGYKGWTPLLPLNFPRRFAFAPDGLILPEDAVNNRTASKG